MSTTPTTPHHTYIQEPLRPRLVAGGGGGGARAFLTPLNLEKYAAAFDVEGADSLGSLEGMTAQEFMNDFGMTKCVQGSDDTITAGSQPSRPTLTLLYPGIYLAYPVPTLSG